MSTAQKYASLPDIDQSGHDVYETSEVAGSGSGVGGAGGGSRRSPTARRRRAGGYGSEDDSSDADEDDEDDADAGRRRRNNATNKTTTAGRETFLAGEDEVERLGIDASKARERFAEATNSQALQSAPARARRRKAGLTKGAFYPPLDTSTYELGLTYPSSGSTSLGVGEAGTSTSMEDPIARLRRLRFEAEEVERELEARGALTSDGQNEVAKRDGEGGDDSMGTTKEGPTPKAILSHVRLLRADLARLEKRTGGTATGIASAEGGALNVDGLGQSRAKLIDSIGKGVEGVAPAAAEDGQSPAPANSSAPSKTQGLGRIDARLKELEDLVGVGEIEVLDENQRIPRPLLPSLSRIEHLLSLITHPRHLDGISRRVKVLVTELDRAHEARRKLGEIGSSNAAGGAGGSKSNEDQDGTQGSGAVSRTQGMSSETLARLDEALPLLSRIEPLLPLAPSLLARLRSLSSLHASASSFASDLSSLRSSQENLEQGQEELERLLGEVKGSMEENEERSRRNAKEVERRIAEIWDRMKRLEME